MTADQVDKAQVYFMQCWPQSVNWPEAVWAGWLELWMAHGRTWVARTFKEISESGEFDHHPPGIHVFERYLSEVESNVRYALREAETKFADATKEGDTEAADKARSRIARVQEVLAR